VIPNAEAYSWARLVNPENRAELLGEPVPVVKGEEAWAIRHGYRILDGEDKKAAIAWANGDASSPDAPAEPSAEPPAPPAAPGVKTTTNTNATKAASKKAAAKAKAPTPPAE
jgi:hypothetical protein